jgi:digeranylgeranylglycerophospholipid reductase
MYDVAVIGAGPAGCRTAALLARDRNVIIVEEHGEVGRPVQCTGLVSPRVVDLCGIKPKILNTLYGANLHFPGGGTLTIQSKNPKALLIDRGDFDRKLADAAVDAGAAFKFNTKYKNHKLVADGVLIEAENDAVASRMIVGADGQNSAVALSLGRNMPKEYVRGMQYDIVHRMDDQRMVEISIGSKVSPGFFTWMIPFGDYTRIGLCCDMSHLPMGLLKGYMAANGVADCKKVISYNGKIPLGGRRKSYGERLLLIGDAAGQVKPISGGGIYPALESANHLAAVAEIALRYNRMDARFLSEYEKRWKASLGREMRRGMGLRKHFCKASDKTLDAVYGALLKSGVAKQFENVDLDHPSDLVDVVMQCPSAMFRLIPLALRTL